MLAAGEEDANLSVRVERDAPLYTGILSCPERRTAVDGPTAGAPADAFRGLEVDEDAAVAVLFGEGGRPGSFE